MIIISVPINGTFLIPLVTENGLIKGAEDIFEGKKLAADYHEEMNGLHFEDHLR
jgi:hypothetical protein